MHVFLGADHRGFALKNRLAVYLVKRRGLVLDDLGSATLEPQDDYPKISAAVAERVRNEEGSFGIVLCGSGAGACMAANKISGVRAVLAADAWTAQAARNDDDANVLCLAAERLTFRQATRIVRSFLQSSFSQTVRYRRRIAELAELDRKRS